MPIQLSQILSSGLSKIPRDNAIVLFSIGPVERFGDHLPPTFHLDKAQAMSLKLAETIEKKWPNWKTVLMPALPLGIDDNGAGFSITCRPHVIRDALLDQALCMYREGFRKFVCVSGQLGPKQLTAIEEVQTLLRRKTKTTRALEPWRSFAFESRTPMFISINSGLLNPKEVKSSPLFPISIEHAGEADTSIALSIYKSRVGPEINHLISQTHRKPTFVEKVKKMVFGTPYILSDLGYWGNPSIAHDLKGEQIIQEWLDAAMVKLTAVYEGANPTLVFRSWYSVFPINRSFFAGWVLTFLAALIFFAWIWVTYTYIANGA